jgi:hypothetical protein
MWIWTKASVEDYEGHVNVIFSSLTTFFSSLVPIHTIHCVQHSINSVSACGGLIIDWIIIRTTPLLVYKLLLYLSCFGVNPTLETVTLCSVYSISCVADRTPCTSVTLWVWELSISQKGVADKIRAVNFDSGVDWWILAQGYRQLRVLNLGLQPLPEDPHLIKRKLFEVFL